MSVINQPSYVTDSIGQHVANLTDINDVALVYFVFVQHMVSFKETIKWMWTNELLQENGYLFISYPKLSNKLGLEGIHRDSLFPELKVQEDGFIEGTDFKFNRMVSFDENYTVVGIKKTKQKSKEVEKKDYLVYLPKLEEKIRHQRLAYDFFCALAPGYKKSWVEYVYSAKKEKTRESRINKMCDCLNAGYKSIDLYRKKPKIR